MIFEEALVSYLSDQAGIVGSSWHPIIVPRKATFPCGRYELNKSSFEYCEDGQIDNIQASYRIEVWAKGSGQYLAIKQIAAALRKALSGYRGVMEGVLVESIFLQNEEDLIAQDEENDEMIFIGVGFDAEIEYHEPA